MTAIFNKVYSIIACSLILSAVCLLGACGSPKNVMIPERQSFAPGSEQSESKTTGKIIRVFQGGEINAIWLKSGLASVDKESEKFCRRSAEEFIRRAQIFNDAILEERSSLNSKDDTPAEPKCRLNIKGGLSAARSVLGRLWISEEYLGGNRSNITLATELYSRKDGRKLSLSDLFGKPEKLPQLFSKAVRDSMAARGGQEDMYIPGTASLMENFRHFLLTENGVMLYFEPCHVAPWAEGVVRVPVSLEALRDADPRNFWKDTVQNTKTPKKKNADGAALNKQGSSAIQKKGVSENIREKSE